jgi:rRNA maturation RNase YbeY
MEERLSITNISKDAVPRIPVSEIKDDILGKSYILSVAYVDQNKSRALNKKYRNKDKPTNVLSFSLSKNSGELVLCPAVIKREVKKFDKTYPKFFGFLVIHGMLHLKGHQHSSRMERAEKKYYAKYFSGHRPGNRDDASRSGRIHQRRKKS